MDKIKDLLSKEIETELNTLEDMDMGSDEQSKAVNDLTKLLDRAIEIEKMDNDKLQKEKTAEIEAEIKYKQLKSENIDRIIKNGLTGVSIIGGFALTVWGTIKSIKFEETGTITTIMGRGFINKLLHK